MAENPDMSLFQQEEGMRRERCKNEQIMIEEKRLDKERERAAAEKLQQVRVQVDTVDKMNGEADEEMVDKSKGSVLIFVAIGLGVFLFAVVGMLISFKTKCCRKNKESTGWMHKIDLHKARETTSKSEKKKSVDRSFIISTL